jgi:large subunit ribosomal protein L21
MYAVFEDGSRQYRVSEGDVLLLDYRDVAPGTRLTLDRVLLYQNGDDTRIGQPIIEGARVLVDVLRRPTEDDKHPSKKYYIEHFRRRKNYRRLKGHRQPFIEVQVKYILLPGMEPPAPPPQATAPASEPATPATAPAPAPAQEPASQGQTPPPPPAPPPATPSTT